jgi:hypothetical protein
MKKIFFAGFIMSLLFVQCSKDTDPFLISDGSIGNLEKTVRMKQIDSIFAQDSIVKLNPIENALGTQGEVEIYDQDGKLLLLITPEDDIDPEARISNIQVFDERYKTDLGLNPKSTFKEIKDNYTIAGIDNAINSVVVYIKDSDIFITIDKKQLPENIRYNYTAKIETSQIPDDATFKYFMISWDHSETKD